MTNLADKSCIPCKEGTPPLAGPDLKALSDQLPSWTVADGHHLEKRFSFANFVEALELVNRIGAIAEEQNHHPDIFLTWGRVDVKIWTHTVDGLSASDFVLAAKIDRAADSAG